MLSTYGYKSERLAGSGMGQKHRASVSLEKSEDRLSENVEGVKEGENSERHTGCCFVLLAVVAPRLKTR